MFTKEQSQIIEEINVLLKKLCKVQEQGSKDLEKIYEQSKSE